MVESEHQHFMALNRKLDDVHYKFILDCSKANICPTLTFKVLKEILGGFELVGCTVGDIRNASRDIKAYAHGFDVHMVLDDMAKKKEMSEAFTYHYEVNATNQLVALFWCDGLMKRNYHMFGDIVAFDSTYNKNRYCIIFTPFMGKDNHGRPVTFAAGLVCNDKTWAFAWLFKHFVECMGVAPKIIVINQDLGMRSTIEEVLVGTRHRLCMWHIMHKLATKIPNRLLRDEDFKKEFNPCVWSDLLEPDEFEDEWNGVVERHGLEDRNSRTKLDYHDATALPILATALPFEKHISTLYTNNMFKKIQEEIVEGNDRCCVLGFSSTDMVNTNKLGDNNRNSNNGVKKIPDKYCESRWMKTPLAKVVHGQFDDALPTRSIVDDSQTVSNQEISIFYGFLRRFETDIDVLRAFVGGVEVVEVHPPDVVKTKGHTSSSPSRLISKREKAIKEATRPLRRCKACDEMGHHDSRNCPMLKEMAMEKEVRKAKRKS
ncbi:protein FAR1-RELATED SEQUENCE 5-like [Salvia splendens]|uniref:protein FAR1-RELATED SEQUENCE 5-like n=1 Tax=Salvia splendens TaxID=180675 RepID=UPI001C25541D|nr:protein FAR1-RELATED SEQUENCE 5-like [Salvia splendens]